MFTVAERAVAPPLPVHVSVYVLAAEMELMVSLPDVALTPDQAPDAVQLEALLEDQVSRVEPPTATVVGAALSETVGAGGGGAFTLTVADRVVVPPVPVQLRSKVLVTEMELIVWLPEVALVPDHAPVAVHVEALVEDQVSCVVPPAFTAVGAALRETVGAGGVGGGCVPGGGVAGGCVEGGCASGDCEPPLPSLDPPPPHAARLKAHSSASNWPLRAVIPDRFSLSAAIGGRVVSCRVRNCEDIFANPVMPELPDASGIFAGPT
ncbi:MAG TPA: hypothetical protein VKE95_07875 [Burkholderiales bacterium]|nr:hypothetical protein [Burkholderiales bacterium]